MADFMFEKVKDYIREQEMLSSQDIVIVGVSGGADSVCLLTILHMLQEEYQLKLFAVHVNHMLRGKEADEDEAYVQQLCDRYSIPLYCVHEDVKKLAELSQTTIEEAGRNLRYQSFEQEFKRVSAHKIAVAHNRNDNAETVLFHLFRGTSLTGMTGIPKKRGQIIRPLLCVTREEIEGFLLEQGRAYRTDSTNLCNDYTRNKIRLDLLPIATKEINEKAVDHITSLAEQLTEVADYIERVVNKEFVRIVTVSEKEISIALEEFHPLEEFIKREMIRKALKTLGGLRDIEAVHLKEVVKLAQMQVGKEIHLPNHIIAKRGYNTLIVCHRSTKLEHCFQDEIEEKIQFVCSVGAEASLEKPQEQTVEIFGKRLKMRIFPYINSMIIPKNSYTKWYDYDKIRGAVVIRARQEGDFLWIHPDGKTKSLKSLMVDQKIPREERDKIPLVVCDSHVLWAVGIRSSEAYRIDQNTRWVLSVTTE